MVDRGTHVNGPRPGANTTADPSPPTQVRWRDLPNKSQLFLLALCRLSEPLSNTCLLPYIFYLVRSVLADAATTDDISLRSGLLVAVFPLAQCLVSLPWGWLSDRRGRRPAVLAGLALSAVANAAFGLSRGLPWLFFWRALAGAANGNVGLMRTMTAEVVRERRFQTKAFLLLPLVFNSGMVVSLALGGVLAEVRVWERYPFALPALMNAAVLGVAFGLAVLGLRETLAGRENERDLGLRVGRKAVEYARRVVFRRSDASYTLLRDTEELGHLEEQIELQQEAKGSTAGTPAVPKGPRLPFRGIWTRRTLAATVSFGLLPLHNAAFMHIFPVYLSTPPSTAPLAGGLGLNSHTIGLWLSAFGILAILLQLFIYPRIQSRLGTLGVFKISLLIFPVVYALAPLLSLATPGTAWSWLFLGCVVWGQIMARTLAIPSTVILLTEAAPSRSVLGTVHGAGNMLASLARAIGPALGGWVFAQGVRDGMIGTVWWFYLVPAAGLALAWCFVVQRDTQMGQVGQ